MARIAYGNRNNIPAAIANNTIPKDTIIITKDDPKDADLLFYDSDANVKSIVTKVRFGSREAAIAFIAENDMIGQTICFPEDDNFKAYIVQSDLSLTEIGSTGVASISAGTAITIDTTAEGTVTAPHISVKVSTDADNDLALGTDGGLKVVAAGGGSGGGSGDIYSPEINNIRVLDRAEYDALPAKGAKTLYLIRG